MADLVINNLFRISVCTLNYVSPSILADILLHPFDFATVLLHIGFDPEGVKNESTALVSVILQYALLAFYIPYLITSIQGLQFMGMPHPSVFYYVNYIYKEEGLTGCYRGLLLKICERLIMVGVNDRIKKSLCKESSKCSSGEDRNESEEDKFLENLVNNVCSQFFSVLISHPFHVLMVASFAEFTYNKNSSILQLFRYTYEREGCLGFFTGLTARLSGEILSLIFSITYTAIINKQSRPQQETVKFSQFPSSKKNFGQLVNYVTNMSRKTQRIYATVKHRNLENVDFPDSRFTALKPSEFNEDEGASAPLFEELPELNSAETQGKQTGCICSFYSSLRNKVFGGSSRSELETSNRGFFALLDFVPFTSKLFYYIMIRDYLSKKISNPFVMVSHCSIILGSGWDRFPLLICLRSLFEYLYPNRIPPRSSVYPKAKHCRPKLSNQLCVFNLFDFTVN